MTTTVAPHHQTRYNVVQLLVVGLLFHLVYIGSVFDCYFTSPVVHGMRSYGNRDSTVAAKRLVLIIGDGLRADLLFTPNAFQDIAGSSSLDVVAPYLRSIAETRGAFGISHTRVPTESRPGHVAIIGGMYEDVSAVTKGWKSNPVDFDSVFNQSSTTFSFGSPDILPMFARGAVPEKVKTWCYDEDEEDFTKDATALDVWVLDHLKALLKNATTDPVLDSQLRSDKVIFFLHLLGLDTTGHSYRPHSKEYMENVRVVDNIVRETESLISEFYKDQHTSFVFTADHGMSTIGNHGDGHPDNTRTPLIAWGSGVRGPLPDTKPSSHDIYSEPWKLGHLLRRDVEQADVAALMAALAGIDWPVNSVGVIPDVDPTRPGYLKLKDGDEGKAKIGLINAKVILEQYRIKDEIKRKNTLFYTPFPLLTPSTTRQQSSDALSFPQLSSIEKLISEEQWFAARQASLTLIQQTLQGLHYLQTYDRSLIRGIVSAAYMGWTAYAILHIICPLDHLSSSFSTSTTFFVTTVSGVVLLVFWTLFALQHSPWSFYVYIAFPCYFWWRVLMETGTVISDWNSRRKTSDSAGKNYMAGYFGISMVIRVVMVVLALQGMVAGYTYRSIWSIGFVLIGVIWPFFWNERARSTSSWTTYVGWATSCLVTAVFPLLPVDKKESLLTIIAGGVAVLTTGLLGAYHVVGGIVGRPGHRQSFLVLTMIQTTFIAIAMVITGSSVSKLQAKAGLPLINQVAGWVVLVVPSLIPFLYPSGVYTVQSKLLMYFLGFGPCFVILSISEEGLFYVAYSITLVQWIQVERIARLGNRRDTHRPRDGDMVNGNVVERNGGYSFQWDDVRTALFFLFFVQVGFFGIGNVASISSFYLAPVYRLIPIFNPFYMATLLIFKIVAPYIILAVIFAVLNDTLHLPPLSLLVVALTITDGMTLTFFFKVQDTGSWLEIGQSITFFCITSALLLWSAGICAAGEYLMKDVLLQQRQVSVEKID